MSKAVRESEWDIYESFCNAREGSKRLLHLERDIYPWESGYIHHLYGLFEKHVVKRNGFIYGPFCKTGDDLK